jgi:hypothetical protein
MKITKTQLKRIIKEEISKVLSEDEYDIETGVPATSPEELESERFEDYLEKYYADPEEREAARAVLLQYLQIAEK